MFNLFGLRRKDEISFDIVAETVIERIVQLVAFDNVAWTLLLVWSSGLFGPLYENTMSSTKPEVHKLIN